MRTPPRTMPLPVLDTAREGFSRGGVAGTGTVREPSFPIQPVSTSGAMLMSVFEGFSDAAKAAIKASHMQSCRLGAPATGPEHLLLGVLTTSPSTATVFADLCVTAAHLERSVAASEAILLNERPDRFTLATKQALEMSLRERLALGDPVVEVEHLALAIINEGCDEIAGMVRNLGTSPAELRAGLLARLGHTGTEPTPEWPDATRATPESEPRGSSTPDEVALRGFPPEHHAYIVDVRYKHPDHAVVQVGFPGKEAFYWLNIFLHDGGWRLEIPDGRHI